MHKNSDLMGVKPNPITCLIPLFGSPVKAGFPSPADDYIESYLDLNDYLISHPAATFFLRAAGDSMINAGISEGDLLIVDRSLNASHGKIVIAAINNELTVKRLYLKDNKCYLLPANDKYKAIRVTESLEMVIWGVVIHVVKSSF